MTEEERINFITLAIKNYAKESQVQRIRAAGRLGGLATARNRKLHKLQKYYQDGIL
jgi:hypothetical protein